MYLSQLWNVFDKYKLNWSMSTTGSKLMLLPSVSICAYNVICPPNFFSSDFSPIELEWRVKLRTLLGIAQGRATDRAVARRQIHLQIQTNTFENVDKSICQFWQIHFIIWEKTFFCESGKATGLTKLLPSNNPRSLILRRMKHLLPPSATPLPYDIKPNIFSFAPFL